MGEARGWPKSLKAQREDLWNGMLIGGFVNARHALGNLEGCTHVRGCVCAQERPENALVSPLANFEALLKQEMKAKAEL